MRLWVNVTEGKCAGEGKNAPNYMLIGWQIGNFLKTTNFQNWTVIWNISSFFSFSTLSHTHTHTPVLVYSSSLADTSINHFQFDTRQKRLHVYYVFMHMIAQIIIMMMVANVACTRHELVSKFLILFIVCSLSLPECMCARQALSHSHYWWPHLALADVALQCHCMTNMHHQIQASKEPHINTSIHACDAKHRHQMDPIRC